MIRVFVTAMVLACCTVAAIPASAAKTPRYLWATVNYCDTTAHPNMMGVRASIPGDGDHTRMYIRLTAQYYDRTAQSWSTVKGNGVSPWLYVGSGMTKWLQGGWQFKFGAPADGKTFVLRGIADFKWTKRGHIVRTAHVLTRAGHPNTRGADPPGFSSALCEIS